MTGQATTLYEGGALAHTRADTETDHKQSTELDVMVSAVMPCLNEERTLAACIRKAQQSFRELGITGEVVVADNGSTDRSVEIAEALGARIIHESRKGYGAALMAGIEGARGRIIVMADSDESYDWLAIGDFVTKIQEGYDLVMGNRFKGGIAPGAMPPLHRYLGNPVLSTLTRLLYRIPIGDFHCGMRAFTKTAYTRMKLRTPGMEFATEMVVYAAQAGLRICEIPAKLFPDKRDRPPHLRSFRDGWRHLRFVVTYAPDYLYLWPGTLLGIFGLIGLIGLSTGPATVFGRDFGIHYLALACLSILSAVSIISFGILAKAFHARYHALPRSAFSRFLDAFTLEKGLLLGLLFLASGGGANIYILSNWILRRGGEMSDTVHMAFVAATAMLMGLQFLFGAFLLNMFKADTEYE